MRRPDAQPLLERAELKAKYEALRAAGKPPKLALTAIMRKLLILANALLRDDRTWAPQLA